VKSGAQEAHPGQTGNGETEFWLTVTFHVHESKLTEAVPLVMSPVLVTGNLCRL